MGLEKKHTHIMDEITINWDLTVKNGQEWVLILLILWQTPSHQPSIVGGKGPREFGGLLLGLSRFWPREIRKSCFPAFQGSI